MMASEVTRIGSPPKSVSNHLGATGIWGGGCISCHFSSLDYSSGMLVLGWGAARN